MTVSRRRWLFLVAISTALAALFEALGFPAGLLLGPLIGGISIALTGETPIVAPRAFLLAQAAVGGLIAQGMPLEIFRDLGSSWPLLLTGVAFVISAAAFLGWLQMRMGLLPGTTALWGAAPGGASAAIIMAEAYGADARLVALMQYLRVAGVALTASLVAHLSAPAVVGAAATIWFPDFSWLELGKTLAIGILGTVIAGRLRLPAGPLLGSMVGCMILSGMGLLTITLPPWLLAIAYAVIGWSIGLRFTRAIILQTLRALPAILASTAALIAICAIFGMVLTVTAGLDPMTAYLATSPGGADSIAIIAASSPVDLPIVMSMQTSRLLAVMLVGPYLTRYIANRHSPT